LFYIILKQTEPFLCDGVPEYFKREGGADELISRFLNLRFVEVAGNSQLLYNKIREL
jgi:hypothetical protein